MMSMISTRHRWLAVGGSLVLAVTIGAGVAGVVNAQSTLPTEDTALEQLERYTEPTERKPIEVEIDSLQEVTQQVVSGNYLLLAAVGSNGLNEPRVVFTVLEPDPEADGWRPVFSIETAALEREPTSRVLELPDGQLFVGYIGAELGGNIEYQKASGEWALLALEGPAGFMQLPADTMEDPQLRTSR